MEAQAVWHVLGIPVTMMALHPVGHKDYPEGFIVLKKGPEKVLLAELHAFCYPLFWILKIVKNIMEVNEYTWLQLWEQLVYDEVDI